MLLYYQFVTILYSIIISSSQLQHC